MDTSIRPGLTVTITGGSIAADGTMTANFTVTDMLGLPLDVNGVTTPGVISVRFAAATIPNGQEQYVSHTIQRLPPMASPPRRPDLIAAALPLGLSDIIRMPPLSQFKLFRFRWKCRWRSPNKVKAPLAPGTARPGRGSLPYRLRPPPLRPPPP